MTTPEPKRKIAVNQLDEIWKVAADRWGDPGRRTPAPDPRFEQLRRHLNQIEVLFGQNQIEPPAHPALRHAQKKPTYSNGRKIEHAEYPTPPMQGIPTMEVNMFGEPAPVMRDDGEEEIDEPTPQRRIPKEPF